VSDTLKFRNVSDRELSVETERGWQSVKPDEVLSLPRAFVESHYMQTGDTGEQKLWDPVLAPKKSGDTK
jgi:hypothetical protein